MLGFPKQEDHWNGSDHDESRIAPVHPPDEPALKEMLDRRMPPGSGIESLAMFRTLAKHDVLLSRMRPPGRESVMVAATRATARSSSSARARERRGMRMGVHVVAYDSLSD